MVRQIVDIIESNTDPDEIPQQPFSYQNFYSDHFYKIYEDGKAAGLGSRELKLQSWIMQNIAK